MASDGEKKKVELNIETYEKLKDFSRFNGIKLHKVIDALTELMLHDESLRDRIIETALGNREDGKVL